MQEAYCRYCGSPELRLNLRNMKREQIMVDDNVKSIVCSRCVQLRLRKLQERGDKK